MRKTQFSLTFLILTVIFILCLIVANLIEIKTLKSVSWLTLTAGVIVFPVSYIVNDCIVEVYGFAKARVAIWLGFFSALFVTLMLQLAILLPGGEFWDRQEAMEAVFGSVPRIMGASFAAFLCGSMVNAFVMEKLRIRHGRERFSFRAIVSSLWGEGVDSTIFFPIAFGGILPWSTIISLIVTQTIVKTAYEIVVLPVTIRVVRMIQKYDGSFREESAPVPENYICNE